MATETSSTGRESDKFMLRLPEGMRDRLKGSAQAKNRTLNAEIVERLTDSFDRRPLQGMTLQEIVHNVNEELSLSNPDEHVVMELKLTITPKNPEKQGVMSREEYDKGMRRLDGPKSRKK